MISEDELQKIEDHIISMAKNPPPTSDIAEHLCVSQLNIATLCYEIRRLKQEMNLAVSNAGKDLIEENRKLKEQVKWYQGLNDIYRSSAIKMKDCKHDNIINHPQGNYCKDCGIGP